MRKDTHRVHFVKRDMDYGIEEFPDTPRFWGGRDRGYGACGRTFALVMGLPDDSHRVRVTLTLTRPHDAGWIKLTLGGRVLSWSTGSKWIYPQLRSAMEACGVTVGKPFWVKGKVLS